MALQRIVSDRLEELFGEHIVARNRPVEWPQRSPDLTPLDFILRGYLKSKVYVTPPANLGDLRKRILHEMRNLSHRTLLYISGEKNMAADELSMT